MTTQSVNEEDTTMKLWITILVAMFLLVGTIGFMDRTFHPINENGERVDLVDMLMELPEEYR